MDVETTKLLKTSLKYTNEVKDLCRPLFEHTSFDYFAFTRCIKKKGQHIGIYSNPEVVMKLMHHNYTGALNHKSGSPLPTGFYSNKTIIKLVQDVLPKRILDLLLNLKGIMDSRLVLQGVYYVRKNEGFDDVFYFAATKHDIDIESYIQLSIPYLQHFSTYFLDKGSKLITEAEKNTARLSSIDLKYFTAESFVQLFPTMNDFLSQTRYKKYSFSNSLGEEVFLSRQEFRCLKYLADGNNSKEIALEMELKQKTVENYLESVKNKLAIHRKSDLIHCFGNSPYIIQQTPMN